MEDWPAVRPPRRPSVANWWAQRRKGSSGGRGRVGNARTSGESVTDFCLRAEGLRGPLRAKHTAASGDGNCALGHVNARLASPVPSSCRAQLHFKALRAQPRELDVRIWIYFYLLDILLLHMGFAALAYVAPPCASAKRLFKGLLNPRFAQRSASRLSSA